VPGFWQQRRPTCQTSKCAVPGYGPTKHPPLKDALGAGYEVSQTGERDLEVRKNAFIRAKVNMKEEPGGTLFHVHGQGMPIPLLFGTMMLVNNLGIAKQITNRDRHERGIP